MLLLLPLFVIPFDKRQVLFLSYASHHSVHQTGLSGGPVCLSLLFLGLLDLAFTNKLKVTCVKTKNLHLAIL